MALGLVLVDGEKKTAVLYKSISCICQDGMVLKIFINGKADPITLFPNTTEERDKVFEDISNRMMNEE